MPSVPKKPQRQSGQADKAGKAGKADNDKSDDYNKSEGTDTKEKSGKSDSGSQDKSDDKTSSKTQSQSKSKDKSRDKSPEKGHGKSPDKDGSHEKSSSKTQSKSQDRSEEKNPEKSQDKKGKSKESDEKGTPKEGSLHEVNQQHGDVKSETAGPDRGLEGISALPEMHALRLMYENAVLNVRNRQLQWLVSELKQEHLITVHQVGQLRKRRGLYTGPAAATVDRAVSATLIGTDGATVESSGVRLDESRYANLTAVVVNIEDKGISAQDESLYALGRPSKGGARKCKHMAGPQDDLNWEELQSRLLPAFYTF